MKISRTEFERFDAQFRLKSRKGGEWEQLRYGQAWYNYFHLQKHTAANEDERKLLEEERARTEETAELRDEDYQLAYAVDIIKGLTAIAPEEQ